VGGGCFILPGRLKGANLACFVIVFINFQKRRGGETARWRRGEREKRRSGETARGRQPKYPLKHEL